MKKTRKQLKLTSIRLGSPHYKSYIPTFDKCTEFIFMKTIFMRIWK